MKLPTAPISLRGGLDLATPAVAKYPGSCIAARNYEPAADGYRRMDGYERFDGQPKPSEATYYVLNFDAGTAAVTEGQTVTGATSSATGKALIDAVVTSGSYAGSDAAGYLVLTTVSGTFQDNENLQVSGVTKSVADGTASEGPVSGLEDNHDTWLQDAIETARNLIAAVPGAGNVLGVFTLAGSVYAIRNNAGNTAAVLHKATTSGWTTQDLGRELDFTSGSEEPSVGDTLSGATSSATAVVQQVILTSGTWAGGDAAGRVIVNGQSGTFQSENLDNDDTTTANVMTIAANSTANTLPAGGRYDVITHNFRGAGGSVNAYLANGVGKAFEFNGTVLAFIETGMTTDTPEHIAEHKNHLFLSFPGGSLQHSSIGEPQEWDVVTGAAELSVGHEINQLVSGWAQVLLIIGRSQVNVLYGSSVDDWDLVPTTEDAGGIEWTAQVINQPVYVDDAGVRRLSATSAWGDFKTGTDTLLVHPLIQSKRKNGVTPAAAVRSKAKTLYYLFYDDKTGLFVYYGRKNPEVMAFELDHQVECITAGEDSSGNEEIYFGSDNGFVYQLNKGTSFDGGNVYAFIRLAYNHLGKPSVNKVWKGCQLELDADPSTTIYLTGDFDYGNPDQPGQPEATFSVTGGGGFWSESNWNEFIWSNPSVGQAIGTLEGFGPSCSLAILSDDTYKAPHTLHGLTFQYAERGYTRAA